MARTREFDPAVALDKGMAVFWNKGYADTSMDDLVDATGVSRYGLYGTFGNKREFFVEALNRYGEMLLKEGFAPLERPDASLAEIRECFEARVEQAARRGDRRGCMACNTATEVAFRDEAIAHAIRGLFGALATRFTSALDNARRKGEIRRDLDTDAVGFYLVGVLQGLAVMARAGYGKRESRRYLDTALSTLT